VIFPAKILTEDVKAFFFKKKKKNTTQTHNKNKTKKNSCLMETVKCYFSDKKICLKRKQYKQFLLWILFLFLAFQNTLQWRRRF